jgi:TolB protein
VINTNGTGAIRLTTNAAADHAPAWSPDGTRIAFQSTRGDGVGFDIFVMNATDGGNVVRLSTDVGDDIDPTWSSDGTKIAFVSSRTGNAEIFTMNPDGTAKTNISNHVGIDAQPSFSVLADSEDLVWTATRDTNSAEIYIMDSDEPTVQTRLTNNAFIDENPSIR